MQDSPDSYIPSSAFHHVAGQVLQCLLSVHAFQKALALFCSDAHAIALMTEAQVIPDSLR